MAWNNQAEAFALNIPANFDEDIEDCITAIIRQRGTNVRDLQEAKESLQSVINAIDERLERHEANRIKMQKRSEV